MINVLELDLDRLTKKIPVTKKKQLTDWTCVATGGFDKPNLY